MRYDSLQLGRGLAALLVVVHHVDGKLAVAYPEHAPFLGGWFHIGWAGVDFFFVLSGFIIAYALSRGPGASDFLARRFARVYPPFWLAFALTLAGGLAQASSREALAQFAPLEWLLALALLPSGASAPVIGVAWTLHHEILFYAVACLWIVLPAWGAALGLGLLAGSLVVPHASFPLSFLFSPLHWEFLFGIVAFALHRRIHAGLAGLCLLAGICWQLGWTLAAPAANDAEGGQRVLQHGVAFGLMCLGAAALEWRQQGRTASWPGHRLWQALATRLGDWSFALYLVHIPVILAVVRVLPKVFPQAGPLAVQCGGVLATVASVIAAWAFHTWLERPGVRVAGRVLHPGQPPAQGPTQTGR